MSNNNDNFFQSFLVGAVIGAVATAILTPYNGDEARDELQNQYDATLGKNETFNRSLSKLKVYSKDKAISLLDQFKQRIEVLIQRIDDIASQGADVLLEDEIL